MTVTDGSRLLAAGHPITLADGRSVNVRFGFRGLLMLEEHFGSLTAVQGVIQTDDEGNVTGKAFEPVARLITAGLASEGIDYEQALDLLDPRQLAEYVIAVGAALEEALPAPPSGADAGKATGRNGSRGKTSTSSAPSASAAPMSSSG